MTPPGRYVDNTHGSLPGVRSSASAGTASSRPSGHYIAPYLEAAAPESLIPSRKFGDRTTGFRLATSSGGQSNGYYQIIDWIKDICKNNWARTIASQGRG